MVEFDGKSDALLCSTTLFGDPDAECLVFHGLFADLPIDERMQAYRSFYGGATTGASTQMGLEL